MISSARTASRTSFVLDTSAVVKGIKMEEHSPAFRAWMLQALGRNDDLLAPHILRYELGQVLARTTRWEATLRRNTLDRLLVGIRFVDGDQAEEHAPPLSFYDASYLALAKTLKATLVTYDATLAKAAKAAKVSVLAPA